MRNRSRLVSLLAVLVGAMPLAACNETEIAQSVSSDTYAFAARAPGEIHDHLSDGTFVLHEPDRSRGGAGGTKGATRVAYFAPNGTLYSWTRGGRIERSRWELRPAGSLPLTKLGPKGREKRSVARLDLCERPVGLPRPGRGTDWTCRDANTFGARADHRKGDVFGLAKRMRPPFALPQARTSAKVLLQRCRTCSA